jgi:hypothetical protein
MATLKDMSTWTDRLGSSKLRTFTDEQGHFWLEQNPAKRSKWAKLAHEGHQVAWEFERPGGTYTGRMLIDGEVYTPSEATKKFLWPFPWRDGFPRVRPARGSRMRDTQGEQDGSVRWRVGLVGVTSAAERRRWRRRRRRRRRGEWMQMSSMSM